MRVVLGLERLGSISLMVVGIAVFLSWGIAERLRYAATIANSRVRVRALPGSL
jgi:hypothetical protein